MFRSSFSGADGAGETSHEEKSGRYKGWGMPLINRLGETGKWSFARQSEAQVEKAVEEAFPYPVGWYGAMPSNALPRLGSARAKKPRSLVLMGRKMIAWRDAQSRPVLMEAGCIHMGASLALGKIEENEAGERCITCPFHSWKFDNQGKCTSVPRVEHIPQTAIQPSYPTAEKYGFVWFWYGTPQPLYPVPDFDFEAKSSPNAPDFMLTSFSFRANAPVERVMENVFDFYHLPELHSLPFGATSYKTLNVQEALEFSALPVPPEAWFGVYYRAELSGYVGFAALLAKVLGLEFSAIEVRSHGWASGNLFQIFYSGQPIYSIQGLNIMTPVAPNLTIQNLILKTPKTGRRVKDFMNWLVFGLQSGFSAHQDVPLWNNLDLNAGGVYVKHDRSVLEYRKFIREWSAAAKLGKLPALSSQVEKLPEAFLEKLEKEEVGIKI